MGTLGLHGGFESWVRTFRSHIKLEQSKKGPWSWYCYLGIIGACVSCGSLIPCLKVDIPLNL